MASFGVQVAHATVNLGATGNTTLLNTDASATRSMVVYAVHYYVGSRGAGSGGAQLNVGTNSTTFNNIISAAESVGAAETIGAIGTLSAYAVALPVRLDATNLVVRVTTASGFANHYAIFLVQYSYIPA